LATRLETATANFERAEGVDALEGLADSAKLLANRGTLPLGVPELTGNVPTMAGLGRAARCRRDASTGRALGGAGESGGVAGNVELVVLGSRLGVALGALTSADTVGSAVIVAVVVCGAASTIISTIPIRSTRAGDGHIVTGVGIGVRVGASRAGGGAGCPGDVLEGGGEGSEKGNGEDSVGNHFFNFR